MEGLQTNMDVGMVRTHQTQTIHTMPTGIENNIIAGLQTSVSVSHQPRPHGSQIQACVSVTTPLPLKGQVQDVESDDTRDVDFVVADAPDTHTNAHHAQHRPGKQRRAKWMRRLQEVAKRALAHKSGIPSGLSRGSRKRKKKGVEKDVKLALLVQSQETAHKATRSARSGIGAPLRTPPTPRAQPNSAPSNSAQVGVPHTAHSASCQPKGHAEAHVVAADWRQASRSDTSLVPHVGAMCAALPTSTSLDRALRAHVELSMLMVWVANSPPPIAKVQVRGHSFGSCGLGVHWWNEARRATKTTHKQENIRLYHAWRFRVARSVWEQWVHILPQVWAEVISHAEVQVQGIVAQIISDCDHITAGNEIQRLHTSVPFTSGYMADAGDRGTKAHFDQATVGDSWVLIFSCLDTGASGGRFWVVDPSTSVVTTVHAGSGTSIVLCKAGWFKHGADPVRGGSRVVTVLWNSPKIRDDRIADPRPLVFEDTSPSWPPGSKVASFEDSPIREGLPPKALHKDALHAWLDKI